MPRPESPGGPLPTALTRWSSVTRPGTSAAHPWRPRPLTGAGAPACPRGGPSAGPAHHVLTCPPLLSAHLPREARGAHLLS